MNIFETFRGNEKLRVEYDPEADWDMLDETGAMLDKAIESVQGNELDALASLLESKIDDIRGMQKKRKMEVVG
jgi:hypothetical protein